MRIWDRIILSGAEVMTDHFTAGVLHAHEGGVWAVAWSPDGAKLADGEVDGAIETVPAPNIRPIADAGWFWAIQTNKNRAHGPAWCSGFSPGSERWLPIMKVNWK